MADFARPNGTLPVLQYCPPEQLEVDPAYQRTTDVRASQQLVRHIAEHWDWRLCQPLVVARRKDERLFVVDGQHRRDAAVLRGDLAQLPCVIVAHDDVAGEARAFVELNRRRRPLTAFQLWRAGLAAGDDEAATIERLVRGAGLRLTGAADPGSWKPGWINHLAGIQRALRRHGERVVARSLEALATGFGAEVLRYGGTLFAAIVPLVAEEGDGLNTWLLAEVLRGADQEGWMRDFATAAAADGKDRKAAAPAVLAAAYREAAAEADGDNEQEAA